MSETFPSFKVVQKDYTCINGTRCIFIRLTINRKSKYFSLNLYVDPDNFRPGAVTRSYPDYKNENTLIDHYTIKAKTILFNCRIEDRFLTFGNFQRDFNNGSYGSKSFLDFYESQIELLKDKLELNTIRAYRY